MSETGKLKIIHTEQNNTAFIGRPINLKNEKINKSKKMEIRRVDA